MTENQMSYRNQSDANQARVNALEEDNILLRAENKKLKESNILDFIICGGIFLLCCLAVLSVYFSTFNIP